MTRLLVTLVVVMVMLLVEKSEGEQLKEDGVLVLTDENFDQAVKEHEMLLVEFYAPWCGHCIALEPEYKKAAKMLAESPVNLAKVDATKEKKVADRFKIDGFPTLKFFNHGTPTEYTGGRDADGIVEWLNKKTGPQWTEVDSKVELEKLVKKKEAIAVGFFSDLESSWAATKLFREVASMVEDVDFFIVSKLETMKEMGAAEASIRVMKSFDDPVVNFKGALTKENLKKFVEEAARPLVMEFKQEHANKIFESDIVNHFILFVDKADKGFDSLLNTLRSVAKDNTQQMTFIHLDVGNEENGGIAEFFGVTKDESPTFAIFEMEGSNKYLPAPEKAKEITVENMKAFVGEYFAGNVKKFLKSESLPENWDTTPVKTLVSSNFEEVAKDKKKDVFVKFYAPWCGHCKAIAPIWDQLGEKYSAKGDLVIAKVDSTKNEIDGVDIEGFPTIKMFKKETNEEIDYLGKKDLESMVKFIETGEQEEVEEEDDYDEDYDDDDFGDDEDEDEDEEDETAEEEEERWKKEMEGKSSDARDEL